MNKIMIAPSILTSSFLNLESVIKELEEAQSDYLHLDIMDGVFVPQITFGAKIVSDIKKASNIPLDVHLMILNPEKHIDDFAKAGADIISVHYEGNIHIHKLQRNRKNITVHSAAVPAFSSGNQYHTGPVPYAGGHPSDIKVRYLHPDLPCVHIENILPKSLRAYPLKQCVPHADAPAGQDNASHPQ